MAAYLIEVRNAGVRDDWQRWAATDGLRFVRRCTSRLRAELGERYQVRRRSATRRRR